MIDGEGFEEVIGSLVKSGAPCVLSLEATDQPGVMRLRVDLAVDRALAMQVVGLLIESWAAEMGKDKG
jgi:hypothetical protein